MGLFNSVKKLTSAILGSCFLYSLIEALFGESEPGDPLPEAYVLMLLSLPYLIDFLVGIYTMIFATEVLEFLAKNSKEKKDEQENLLTSTYNMDEVKNKDSNLCAICMEAERNCVFYKCGHKATCYDCGSSVKRRVNLCPICRREISDIVKVFD